MAKKQKAQTEEYAGMARHIIVNAKTGEVVEEWRPIEPPEPAPPHKPSLQEQLDALRARIEKLESK